jgi:hypothetical protein
MSDTSLVFNAVGRDRGVNALLTRTAGNVRASSAAGAAGTVLLGTAMASAAAQAVALGTSVLGAVGAVGLLPAAVAAAGATVIGARAITFGLADAWKATGQAAASGGGRAGSAARQVAAAHREVTSATEAYVRAQRDALAAQAAVTQARIDETERLSDLTRTLNGARLDEEGAVRAVAKAQADLTLAQRSGNPSEIADADLAYRQSLQTLDEVKDRVDDLGKEQKEGAAKGVEGSDAVQQALQRQRDAQDQVVQAAQRLADAQDAVRQSAAGAASGGINPAAAALAKLAPNARAAVLQLRALVPAWQGAARFGQQRAFAGVVGDLRQLSGLYLPTAAAFFGRLGASINRTVRESVGLFQTRAAIRDVGLFTDNAAVSADRLARAVKPVISGILQWVAIGSNFLPGLAGNALTIAQRFERWSVEMRKSGQAASWIGNGVRLLKQFAAIATDVALSVVAIFHAGGDGGSTIDTLQRGAAAMRRWLESAQGQQKITQVLTTLRGIVTGVGQALVVVAGHGGEFNDALNVTGTVVGFAAGHLDTLAKLLPVIAAGYVISKTAETGANIAKIIQVPLLAAQVAANWGMRAALTAHTIALRANTAATETGTVGIGTNTAAENVGILARGRAVVGLVASKVAMVATAAATRAYAAAQWLLNAALDANPLGLIIIALAAVAAGVYLLWTRSETFRKIVTAAFGAVWDAIKAGWHWVQQNWPLLLAILIGPVGLAVRWVIQHWDQVTAVFTRFRTRLGGLWDGLKSGFRGALNWIIGKWNNFHIGLPGFSFAGVSVPGISIDTPNLPMLARGGTATAAGAAVVGDDGPEVVHLDRGASVVPLPKNGGDTGRRRGRGGGRLVIVAGDREAVAELRRLQQQYGF